jgi:hypothetical protein
MNHWEDDALEQRIKELDKSIDRLRSDVRPPTANPNSILYTFVQLGVAVGRILQPLREPPRASPDDVQRSQRVFGLAGLILVAVIVAGALGGYVWDPSSPGRTLATHLAVGAGVGLIAGPVVVILGWMMGYTIRTLLSVSHRRPNRTRRSDPDTGP